MLVKCVVTLCWVLGMNERMSKICFLLLRDSKPGGISCCIYLLLCLITMKKVICDECENVDHVMVVGIPVLDCVIFLLAGVSLH